MLTINQVANQTQGASSNERARCQKEILNHIYIILYIVYTEMIQTWLAKKQSKDLHLSALGCSQKTSREEVNK